MASEKRDGRLAAFEAEALLADVLGVQELLERLGCVQLVEDPPVLVGAQLGRNALDVLLDPSLLLRLLDVHVLDADRPAVGVAQRCSGSPPSAHPLGTGQALW